MSHARFRLRFLLQEIDLTQGDTLIGRSANCQVTIEDPLVSREHARIRILGERATVEDLGSRNGTLVGGRAVTGAHVLEDGERLRIGSQELVFCAGAAPGTVHAGSRTTAFMGHCSACGRPFPLELEECPTCGTVNRKDEDTLTGAATSPRDWGLELVIEALKRAERRGVADDIERLLSHARLAIEQRLAGGSSLERPLLDGLSNAAAHFATKQGNAAWAQWLLSVHASLASLPPSRVTHGLLALPATERSLLAPAARRVMESVRAHGGPQPQDEAIFTDLQALADSGRGFG